MISFVLKPITRMVLRIVSFILFAVTIACAYSGLIKPSISGMASIAVMLLPYLATASLIVTIVWFISGHWITGAIGALAIAAAWTPISWAVPFRTSHNPTAGATTFSLLSWNFLHSWEQDIPFKQQEGNKALDFIIGSGADIVCLQEISKWDESEIPNFTPELKARLEKAYPYSTPYGNYDTRILSKYPVEDLPSREFVTRTTGTTPPDSLLHWMSFNQVDIKGNKLMIVNVHLYSPALNDKERDVVTDIKSASTARASAHEFKASIREKIQKACVNHDIELSIVIDALKDYEGPVIVCGDFNDVPGSYAFRKMIKAGFSSVYAEVGFGPVITYNRHMMWLQLDHIFYRGDLRPLKIKKEKIKTSDHYPLMSEFEFTNPK